MDETDAAFSFWTLLNHPAPVTTKPSLAIASYNF